MRARTAKTRAMAADHAGAIPGCTADGIPPHPDNQSESENVTHNLPPSAAPPTQDILLTVAVGASERGLTALNQSLKQVLEGSGTSVTVTRDLDEILAAASACVLFIGKDMCIRHIAPLTYNTWSLTPADIGRPVTTLSAPCMSPWLIRTLQATLETGSTAQAETQNQSGEWHSLRILPNRSLDGQIAGALIVLVDVDARKHLAELEEHSQRWHTLADSLQESRIQLEKEVEERAARLRNISRELESLSYCLSHDLRPPVRAMLGYAELALQDDTQLTPQVCEYLERIMASANRADHLIRDVLTYQQVSCGNLQLMPVNLEPLILQILQDDPRFRIPHTVIRVLHPLKCVLGHEATLMLCLTHLLDNAIKFAKPGTPPCVRLWTEPTGDYVRIWVEDQGVGIQPDRMHQIFGISERTRPPGQQSGAGLGLAIVRKGVERMGGSVGVLSEPGQGSRFWIQLRGAEISDSTYTVGGG